MQADMPVAPLPPAPPIRVDGQLSRAKLLQRDRQRRYRALQAASSISPAAPRSPQCRAALLSRPVSCPASAPGHQEMDSVLLTASPLARVHCPTLQHAYPDHSDMHIILSCNVELSDAIRFIMLQSSLLLHTRVHSSLTWNQWRSAPQCGISSLPRLHPRGRETAQSTGEMAVEPALPLLDRPKRRRAPWDRRQCLLCHARGAPATLTLTRRSQPGSFVPVAARH